MAEELNKPAPASAQKPSDPEQTGTNPGGIQGDIPMLLENVGNLIDSTIESVSDMLNSATNVTGQIIENVNVTVQSDAVQGIMKNIGNVSEKVAESVNATLNAQQLKDSLSVFGQMLDNITETFNTTVNSEPVRNLFETVSTGINQLMNNLLPQDGSCCSALPKAVHIPYSQKKPVETAETATSGAPEQTAPSGAKQTVSSQEAPAAPEEKLPAATVPVETEKKPAAPVRTEPLRNESGREAYITLESGSPAEKKQEDHANDQKSQGKNQNRKGKFDPSRKGTFPRSKGRHK